MLLRVLITSVVILTLLVLPTYSQEGHSMPGLDQPVASEPMDMGQMDMPMMGMCQMQMCDMSLCKMKMKLKSLEGVDLEREFLIMMIDHHMGAVDMSNFIIENGKDPDVKAWATAIVSAQQDEIAEMQQLLSEKNGLPQDMPGMGMSGHSSTQTEGQEGQTETTTPQAGMMCEKDKKCEMMPAGGQMGQSMMGSSDMCKDMMAKAKSMAEQMSDMMESLRTAPDPDRAFVEMMVKHHSAAIEMSLIVLMKAEDRRILELTRNIITTQAEEIYQFVSWLHEQGETPA